MDTPISEGLVFKLLLAEIAAGTVATPPIAITLYLYVVEHCSPHYLTAGKAFPPDGRQLIFSAKLRQAFIPASIAVNTLL